MGSRACFLRGLDAAGTLGGTIASEALGYSQGIPNFTQRAQVGCIRSHFWWRERHDLHAPGGCRADFASRLMVAGAFFELLGPASEGCCCCVAALTAGLRLPTAFRDFTASATFAADSAAGATGSSVFLGLGCRTACFSGAFATGFCFP